MTDSENCSEDLLKKLVYLVAVGVVEGKKQEDQIRILSVAGFTPKEIAEFLGTTPNNVRVRLSAIRKSDEPRVKRGAND